MAIGRLAVKKGALQSLKIGELSVDRLRVSHLLVSDSLGLPTTVQQQLNSGK